MPLPKLTKQFGFTIMEGLIVASVLAIVAGSIFSLFLSGHAIYPLVSSRQQLLYETSRVLNRVSELVMESSLDNINIITDTNYLQWENIQEIEFFLPFEGNERVQLDDDKNIIWGSYKAPKGEQVFRYVDDDDGFYHFVKDGSFEIEIRPFGSEADAKPPQQTMFALKETFGELILPVVYAAGEWNPGDPQLDPKAYNLTLVLRDSWQEKVGTGGNYAQQFQKQTLGGIHITELAFTKVNEQIEITLQAEKTDWQGRSVSVALTTQVTPRN